MTIPTSPGFSLGTAEYVVTVGVGTPAVSQVVSIDTGSDVSWVQCAPCPARSCHCWRMSYWYQHVSAGPIGAGTNVHVQYKAGTLVPASNTSRH